MKRPRTTSLEAPLPDRAPAVAEPTHSPAPSWRELAPIVAALLAVIEIVETTPRSGPALKVHRSTMRWQGEAAAAIGGAETMKAALR